MTLRAGSWIDEPLTPSDVYRRKLTQLYFHRRSVFQEICIAEAGAYGKALILDGQLQCSVADEFLYHEALVHPPLMQVSSPRNVLIVGGGDGAAAREALRWRSVTRVSVVEADREVVAACKVHLQEIHQNAFDDPRLEIVIDEGFRFLRNTDRTWDVIIFDLPDPVDGAPWLTLYQQPCFETVRERLAPGGCLALQAGPVSPVAVAPLSRIVNDARTAFPHVHAYSTFVPSFGIPLAFVLARARPLAVCPNPQVVDRAIAENLSGTLRLLDGMAFLGLMQTPAYLRAALQADHATSVQIPVQIERASAPALSL